MSAGDMGWIARLAIAKKWMDVEYPGSAGSSTL